MRFQGSSCPRPSPSGCFSFLQVHASEPMNLQRFFRVAISLKKMIFHRGTFLFGNPANEGIGIGSPKAGKTLDRRSQTGRFAWRPTIRRHFFRMRVSHVFIREVTVLIGFTPRRVCKGFPRFRVRTATARALSSGLGPVSKQWGNYDRPFPGRWVPPPRARGTSLGASSRRREPAHFAHERPDRVAAASRSPRPSFAPSPPPRVERLFEKGHLVREIDREP